jgi:2-iminobutanoate/2-iminopropanoate deaminase
MQKRRAFFKSAAKLGAGGAMASMAMAAAPGGRAKAPGGIRVGNLYFSSGLTGVRPGNDIKDQTRNILEAHKQNLEKMGSALENVVKVTVFLADVRKEKPAMNEVYAQYFPKDAPSRSAFGVQFPDDATRVEIELVAWIP